MKILAHSLLVIVALVSWTGGVKADYVFSTLATFDGANGANPTAALISDSAGNLYGTTSSGGAYGKGAVYEIAAGTNALTTLYSFSGNDGQTPYASLTRDSAGNLYGTTYGGGVYGQGTVFKLAAGSSALTTLYSFNGTDGKNPRANLLADSSGNLYGTTEFGGASDLGTAFRLAAGTNTLTTLASFSGANGTNPWGGLVADTAGNLYGTTRYGGSGDYGTVFEIAAGTSALSTLVTFNFGNGAYPLSGLIVDSAGNLFGATAGGGGNNGTVFKIAAGTQSLAWSSIMGSTLAWPYGGVTLDGHGNLFGTTNVLGAYGPGTVFVVSAEDPYRVPSPIYSFAGLMDGANPWASVFVDGAGNLYGTTFQGGANGFGTVFKLTAVPEPSSMLLASVGALAFAAIHSRRRLRSFGK